MTNDERLGANPLAWVEAKSPAKSPAKDDHKDSGNDAPKDAVPEPQAAATQAPKPESPAPPTPEPPNPESQALESQRPESKPRTPDTPPQDDQQDGPACGAGAPATDNSLRKRILSPGNAVHEEHHMSKSKVKIEQVIETRQVVKHLTDLAKSLENGVIRAEDAENSVVLRVPEMLQFEMKVSRKKDKGKCSLELSWKDDGTLDEVFKVSDN